ncbi:MAG: hypothetical protein PVH58_16470, partial [Desulfobacterales bacterium]
VLPGAISLLLVPVSILSAPVLVLVAASLIEKETSAFREVIQEANTHLSCIVRWVGVINGL